MKPLFLLIVYPILILLLTTNVVKSQKTCPFPINEKRILSKQGLDTFLHLLKTDSFVVKHKRKNIPHFIKKELNCLANGFRIANPGKPYNISDFITWARPSRQLTFM